MSNPENSSLNSIFGIKLIIKFFTVSGTKNGEKSIFTRNFRVQFKPLSSDEKFQKYREKSGKVKQFGQNSLFQKHLRKGRTNS